MSFCRNILAPVKGIFTGWILYEKRGLLSPTVFAWTVLLLLNTQQSVWNFRTEFCWILLGKTYCLRYFILTSTSLETVMRQEFMFNCWKLYLLEYNRDGWHGCESLEELGFTNRVVFYGSWQISKVLQLFKLSKDQ